MPFTPTPQQTSRHAAWVEDYLHAIEDEWKRDGQDIEAPAIASRLQQIRAEVTLADEPDWMDLPDAISALLAIDGEAPQPPHERRRLFNAMRTSQGIGTVAWYRATAEAMGLSASQLGRYVPSHLKTHDGRYVYRIHDRDDTLLYIGSSSAPYERLGGHEAQSLWWPYAVHMTVEHYPTRADGYDAERAAIHAERPMFNINGTSAQERAASAIYLADMLT